MGRSELGQTLKRLREQGLIEFVDDHKLSVRLTDPGRSKALLAKVLEPAEWDGKWRIVIFDIPERRRAARDLLRLKLKQLQFIKWQKSVWATRVDCIDLLRKFIKDVGIGDWVRIIESDNV